MSNAAPWTFDAHARSEKPRGMTGNAAKPRTAKHHPNLKDLGHRFGPALCCEWCGRQYALVGAEGPPCERALMLGALAAFGRP